jgi:hypothetical protein
LEKEKNLKKALGRFWPTAVALAASGLPRLSGPKAEIGLLGWPIGLAQGSTHWRGHRTRAARRGAAGGDSSEAPVARAWMHEVEGDPRSVPNMMSMAETYPGDGR